MPNSTGSTCWVIHSPEQEGERKKNTRLVLGQQCDQYHRISIYSQVATRMCPDAYSIQYRTYMGGIGITVQPMALDALVLWPWVKLFPHTAGSKRSLQAIEGRSCLSLFIQMFFFSFFTSSV